MAWEILVEYAVSFDALEDRRFKFIRLYERGERRRPLPAG